MKMSMPVDRAQKGKDTFSSGAAQIWAAPGRVRDRSIDIARGLAMIGVVAGHALVGVAAAGFDHSPVRWAITALYSWHIATFFVIAGLLSGGWAKLTWLRALNRLFTRVVWPYLLWSVVLVSVHFLMTDMTNVVLQGFAPWRILYQPPAFMWFFYLLAFGLLCVRFLAAYPGFVSGFVGAILILLSYAVKDVPNVVRFLGVMIWAAAYSNQLKDLVRHPISVMLAVLVMVGLWAMGAIASDFMETGYPAGSWIFVPAMVAGPIVVLALAHQIAEAEPGVFSEVSEIVGKNTLPIFVTHVYFTAGTRIVSQSIGVDPGYIVVFLGTVWGVGIPIWLARCARAHGFSAALGWR